MMAPIRVAVFGAGYWGTKLCREYAAIEKSGDEASLAWIVDASAPALESIKAEIGGTGRTFGTSYQAALDSGKIDAVHVALPTHFHYTSARAALEAGKHVLLEKPMAPSSREAFKLASLAEQRGLVLQVGHIFRFNAALRMVREMILQGHIGKVFYAKLEWTTNEIPKGERDIIFDLAPHPIDILNFLLDEWPIAVDAVGESYHRQKESLEEAAFINLEFPDRVVASVYLSWIQHGGKDRMVRIVGEQGTIFCDALNQTVTLYTKKGESKIPMSLFPKFGDGQVPNNTIRAIQLNFLNTIRGRGPQLNSAMIGARNVAVLETITRAMRTRRAAQIQPERDLSMQSQNESMI